jgi:hypothetical protein
MVVFVFFFFVFYQNTIPKYEVYELHMQTIFEVSPYLYCLFIQHIS